MLASLIDQAIQFLVEKRWPMLPSKGPKKGPCVPWKQFQEHLPAEEDLRQWDRRFKPARWGVVTGKFAGIAVADFDGDAGLALMEKWGIKPHVRTGSGGFHLYVQHPGWKVTTMNAKTSKAKWPWPGLDIRGDGGFAVLLGRNENGPYEIIRNLEPDSFESLPEEVRTFLHNQIEREEPTVKLAPQQPIAVSRLDAERLIGKAVEMAPNDGRNNAGFWLACQLRDNGYTSSETKSVVLAFRARAGSTNVKGQREPYTAAEVFASVKAAFSAPVRNPWESRSSDSRRPERDTAMDSMAETGDSHADRADEPGSIGIYVGHTGEPLVGHTGEPLSRTQYFRIPREVSADRRLNQRDKSVYSVLGSFCWQGSVAQVGKRLIAKLAGCAERLVISSLKKLEITGHIQKVPGRLRGQRGRYILLSPVFGQKQRAGIDEVVRGPNGPRLVAVRKQQGMAPTLRSEPRANRG